MKDKYFIDTNIFVYAFDHSSPEKQRIANDLIKSALFDNKGCVSSQVVQEFINVATRKFATPMRIADCEKYLQNVLYPLCASFTSLELYNKALDIMSRWQYSFYDTLIIAAALQTNCNFLYTEDLQHLQKIQSLMIINPFM